MSDESCKPKSRWECGCGSGQPSIEYVVVNLLLKLRWIHLGILNLRSSLIPQVNNWLRSSCKHNWSEETTILLDSLASSANRNILENFMTDGKSLMYSKKSSGPRILP